MTEITRGASAIVPRGTICICERCGETFAAGKNSAGRFCSRACTRKPRTTILCAWCGEAFEVRPYRVKENAKFCSPACAQISNSGERNSNFNGGLSFNQGRWLIWCRDNMIMLFSRAVMAGQIGRLLRSDEIVHHQDEDTANDDPANLELTTRAEHIQKHRQMLNDARRAARAAR